MLTYCKIIVYIQSVAKELLGGIVQVGEHLPLPFVRALDEKEYQFDEKDYQSELEGVKLDVEILQSRTASSTDSCKYTDDPIIRK